MSITIADQPWEYVNNVKYKFLAFLPFKLYIYRYISILLLVVQLVVSNASIL